MTSPALLTRRQALGLAAVLCAAGPAEPGLAGARRPAVVELFTSQGCSSCPPADAYMRELAKRDDVLALTFNVDYWDYLGWRDTLASPACSQRQYDYAKSRGDMDVYTPQMIVDGRAHLVGSHREAVESAIRRSLESTPSPWVPMSVSSDGKEIVVEVEAGAPARAATVWLMAVAPEIAVKIERGENSGKSIVYCNVVRSLTPLGAWSGGAVTLKVAADTLLKPDCTACVALLQTGAVGPVIGAARWEIGPS